MQKILESLADKIIITKDFPFYMRLISWFCFSLSYFKQELFSVLQVCEIDFSFVTKLVRTNENYIYLFLTIFTFFNSTSEKSPASAGGEMNRHLCHQPVTIGM
ncbi:hypothetical protein [Anaerobutyricum hallii]|uniref:hypothetical protein n=2 Tax=Anaerobutyricum hallii TaxID=39488 RepID=UPI002ED77F54